MSLPPQADNAEWPGIHQTSTSTHEPLRTVAATPPIHMAQRDNFRPETGITLSLNKIARQITIARVGENHSQQAVTCRSIGCGPFLSIYAMFGDTKVHRFVDQIGGMVNATVRPSELKK